MNAISNARYAKGAYDSRNIPSQTPQTRHYAGLLTSPLLPWGGTEDVAPPAFIDGESPKDLRALKKQKMKQSTAEQEALAKLHSCSDHICFRYARASGWTRLWLYLWGLGRATFFLGLAMLLLFQLPFALFTSDSMYAVFPRVTNMAYLLLPTPLACWIIGHIAMFRLPRHWIVKPSKGPLWELNRQTGQVTVFARKPRQFAHLGIEGDFVRPFYEFDACVHLLPTRQGIPQYSLHLIHRYTGVAIDFKSVLGLQGSADQCHALWDMWQNYMDISHPLPDIPTWEEFRPLDPTSVEHDRKTGRPPRYWRDMDDATYKRAMDAMGDRVRHLNAPLRPNIMARHVLYL